MSSPLSAFEAKELIRLCESGRLYEVEAWLAAGRSLTIPKEVRKTPLRVAISTGFHSLVELLLRHELRQGEKDDALRHALFLNRFEFVELAVEHGASIGAIPFLDVLMTGDRALVATFLEKGADATTDYPFARAFINSAPKRRSGRTWIAGGAGPTSRNTSNNRLTWCCVSSARRAT